MGQGRAIVVNSILAKQNGVQVGETLTLQTASGPQAYEVVGIGLDYLNAKAAAGYVSHAMMAQDFLETGDVLILIALAEGVDRAQVQAGLLAAARDYPAFSLLSFEQLRDSQLQAVQGQKLGMIMVVAMLAVPSLLALANTLGINVLERTREIGMMRAVGATRRQVRRMIVAESLLLSAMGVAFGILAGIWMGYVIVGAMSYTGLPLAYYFPYAGILIAIAVGLCWEYWQPLYLPDTQHAWISFPHLPTSEYLAPYRSIRQLVLPPSETPSTTQSRQATSRLEQSFDLFMTYSGVYSG